MAEIFEFLNNNKAFRVRYDAAEEKSIGTCLLIQSGQTGKYDEATPEVSFHNRLAESLNAISIGVLRLDMESRDDLRNPAEDNHLSERTSRIRYVLEAPEIKEHLSSLILFGISLGAQSIVRLISDSSIPKEPLGVILVSCVIEEPVTVMSDLHTVRFIYGSRDYIAYVHSKSSEIVPVAPEEYGQKTCRFMILRPWQKCSVDIYEDLGHLLLTGEDHERNNYAVSRLSNLIENILNASRQ